MNPYPKTWHVLKQERRSLYVDASPFAVYTSLFLPLQVLQFPN